MKIVIADVIGIPQAIKDELRKLGATVHDDRPDNKDEVIERMKDAEIITANYVAIDKEVIDAAAHLKYIIVPAVGYDWVDHEYATVKGIKVINCPTYVSLAVAEHTIALMLALARRLLESNADFKRGKWDPNYYAGFELAGKKLGLVGYGNIGENVERLAKGLGMQVNHTDSQSSDSELDALIRESDVICLCLPLNKATRHLIDARRLSLLKKDAYLINVARGAIVDQKALIKALKNNQFAGAGLDVYDGEPLVGEPSQEIMELINLPNVVATPHIAYNTNGALERLGQEIFDNIQACLNGEPKNVVN